MTLMFGTILALGLGVLLGHRLSAYALTALAWYVFLSVQTAYLAEPGKTGFGGTLGTDALQGVLYWIAQPVLLAMLVGLTWVGGRLRERITFGRAVGEA